MSDARVYARQLLPKLNGYPLWVPEPFGHTPVYRTKGVRIGDVGYITPEGGFETLFNIRASRDDPINCHGVPKGFEQIHLEHQDITQLPNYHPKPSVVAGGLEKSHHVGIGISTPQNSVPAGAEGCLEYTWHSSEGAILHLPEGATRRRATRLGPFMKQILKHGLDWHEFATKTLERDLPLDSLYLITGYDKSQSWMAACFSNYSSNRQVVLRLNASFIAEGGVSYQYSWSSSSPPSYRVGSTASVIPDNLDNLDRDDAIFASDAPDGQNQCGFVWGYLITARTNPLVQLLFGALEVKSPNDTPLEHGHRNSSWSGIRTPSLRKEGKSSGGWYRQSHNNPMKADLHGMMSIEHTPDGNNVPGTQIAVTYDGDWTELINPDDTLCPSETELLRRYQQTSDPITNSNVTFSRRQLAALDDSRKVYQNDTLDERASHSDSDDGANYVTRSKTAEAGPEEEASLLTSQTLNPDGTPKRPMNAYMIFRQRRYPQLSAENRTGQISEILSREWNSMEPSEKQFYLDQAKLLKDNFHSTYPDYIYQRRLNNS